MVQVEQVHSHVAVTRFRAVIAPDPQLFVAARRELVELESNATAHPTPTSDPYDREMRAR